MCTTGISENLTKEIVSSSGFSKGSLPFKHIRVHLIRRRLKPHEYGYLVDKMVGRIRSWASKTLSFGDRHLLIDSVLISITSYWAQVMILPSSLIKLVNIICRSCLWIGSLDSTKPRPIAWDFACSPKKNISLGIWNVGIRNTATVGKLLWHLAMDKQSL